MPILADRNLYICAERRFYRVLYAHGKVHLRDSPRPPWEPQSVPQLEARGPNQVWRWEHTYPPNSVRGIWLYLHLVIDVSRRNVVAWDVAGREQAQIDSDLFSRSCLLERISKECPKPLILHVNNVNDVRAATPESRLEELGVLSPISRIRISNDNPYAESLCCTMKYRPDYPRPLFRRVEESFSWVASFVGWYNHQHRHCGIRFVTTSQRHSADAVAISYHCACVYEHA